MAIKYDLCGNQMRGEKCSSQRITFDTSDFAQHENQFSICMPNGGRNTKYNLRVFFACNIMQIRQVNMKQKRQC